MVVGSCSGRRLAGVGLAPGDFGIQTWRSRLGPSTWLSSSWSPAWAACSPWPTMAATTPEPNWRSS
eukprot:11988205-Prorocentrum_lima.AAC.1